MFYWLMRYATQFGQEFPLHLFPESREYELQQIVVDCCNSGKPFTAEEKPKREGSKSLKSNGRNKN